jgi:hypothetical protein
MSTFHSMTANHYQLLHTTPQQTASQYQLVPSPLKQTANHHYQLVLSTLPQT